MTVSLRKPFSDTSFRLFGRISVNTEPSTNLTANFTSQTILSPVNASGITLTESDTSVNSHTGDLNTTITLSGITTSAFAADQSDRRHTTTDALAAYTPVLALYLMQGNVFIPFPDACEVSVNGDTLKSAGASTAKEMLVENGGGSGVTNADYKVEITGLPIDKTTRVCFSLCAADNSRTDHAMNLTVCQTPGTDVNPAPEYAIRTSLSVGAPGNDSTRAILEVPTENKDLSFDVTYYVYAGNAESLTVTAYCKGDTHGYAEITGNDRWQSSIILTDEVSPAAGKTVRATVTVTIPAGTPAGTYRLTFRIGSAECYYNIIII